MSSPPVDLSKVQYFSGANSFKNDSQLYTGSLTLSASIPAGSFLTSSTTITLASSPQFSMLYAKFQEFGDVVQQATVGSGFNGVEWYQASVDVRFGAVVTSPGATPPIDGVIYPVINGNQVTVTALINNPYRSTLVYNALTIPFAFIEYTLTN